MGTNRTRADGPADGGRLPYREPATPAAVLKAADRRRRLLRALKIILPAATAAIVLLALFWPQLIGVDNRIDLASPATVDGQDKPPEAIVNAAYSGIDREGRPFAIRAQSVSNQPGDAGALQLAQPDAQIVLKDGTPLTIAAERGLYRRDEQTLELYDGVTLRRGADLTVRTESATIELRTSSASGDQKVDVTSTHGTVTGSGFRIANGGDPVFVHGPAQMQVVQSAKTVLP